MYVVKFCLFVRSCSLYVVVVIVFFWRKFSLCCYINYFLSFQLVKCSILEIKSTFFFTFFLNIKFIIGYNLLGIFEKYAVPSYVSILVNKTQPIVRSYSCDTKNYKYDNLF